MLASSPERQYASSLDCTVVLQSVAALDGCTQLNSYLSLNVSRDALRSQQLKSDFGFASAPIAMSSAQTDSWTRVQSSSGGRGRGSEPSRGGRGHSRGRGRGRGRTPSTSGHTQSPSGSAPNPPVIKDKPSLLSRIDPNLPVTASSSSPLSGRSPSSPSDITSPGGSNTNTKPRKRKGSNATNGSPRSPVSASLPSPLGRKPHQLPPKPSPLAAPSMSKDPPPHLAVLPDPPMVSDAPSPKLHSPTPTKEYASHSFLLPNITDDMKASSPMASPRPFTPQGRDWAAEDDDDDAGSLPSLDDWGIADIKSTASDAGEHSERKDPQGVPSASFRKLSLSTDTATLQAASKASVPSSAVESPSGFANVIPPTPVAVRPGQEGLPSTLGPSKLQHSHLPHGSSKLASETFVNRAGKSMSRDNSPHPLNLDGTRSPSPGWGTQSGSPRPTSGGVPLGRGSPAPGSPNFTTLRVGSSAIGSTPNSPNHRTRSPSSPGLLPQNLQGTSRPSSPRPLSGGVSLGVSRPTSPNPGRRESSPAPGVPQSPPAPTSANRSTRTETTSWRDNSRQANGLPAKPGTSALHSALQTSNLPLASRISDPVQPSLPNRGGRGGGRGSGRGGRGGFGRNESNAGLGPNPGLQNAHNPGRGGSNGGSATTNRPPVNIPSNSRGGGRGRGGHSRTGSDAGSPTSATSVSSAGRLGRGHARASSRPIISATALSRISASLSPSKRSTENASAEVNSSAGA